jgi:hypothetical protein
MCSFWDVLLRLEGLVRSIAIVERDRFIVVVVVRTGMKEKKAKRKMLINLFC